MAVASRAAQAASFIRPEILAIPAAKMKSFLDSPVLAPYKLLLRARAPLQAAHAGQEGREPAGHADRNGPGGQPDLPPAQRRRLEVRRHQERPRRRGRAEPRHLQRPAARARSGRAAKGLSSVLPRVCRSRPYAGRVVGRLDAGRHLLRQGAELSQRPGGRLVPRPGAGDGLRQPHRLGPSPPARLVSLLRRAAAEDAAEGHPSLRHLRADPRRPAAQAHLGPGGQRGA